MNNIKEKIKAKFKEFSAWGDRNYNQIVWFTIGWLAASGLRALVDGHYGPATIDAALIALNYAFWSKRGI